MTKKIDHHRLHGFAKTEQIYDEACRILKYWGFNQTDVWKFTDEKGNVISFILNHKEPHIYIDFPSDSLDHFRCKIHGTTTDIIESLYSTITRLLQMEFIILPRIIITRNNIKMASGDAK